MSREKKFRAWNPIEQKIEYYTFNDLCYNSNRPDICLEKWQESTGILDKNGKEIYVGDIVKFTLNQSNWIIEHYNFPVSYDDKYGNINLGEIAFDYKIENIEVVGNLRENPELLTQNKN